MSIFVVLKFLNKMFPLFTIFLELCSDFNIPVASASCIIIWFVSTYVISKFFKTGDPSAEHRFETDRNLSLQECTVMTNFKKHSFLLKRISYQIAEDRRHLMQTKPPDYPALEYHLLEVLESKHHSVFETVSETVELKNTAQNRRIGEVMRSLDELQGDFLAVKNLLQQLPVSPYCLAIAKKSFGNNREQYEEVIYSELLNEIEAASKECFSKLESETKMKGKEVINSISRYIDKSRKDIRQELTLFSSAVEKTEKDRKEASNISLISKVENIEKNLLDTVVFLNRQRFDMENLQKILKHFDEKFTYVATKFDAYWNQSKTAYSNAAQRLETTVNLWTAISEKVDNNSGKLIRMLESVTAMISDTQNTLKLRQCDDVPATYLAKNSDNDVNVGELPFFENFEIFSRKFEDLLSIAENTKEKLLSLTQASKSLQNSHDLIRSITEGYNSLLSFFWPSLEKSTTVEAKLTLENRYKNGESCVDPWKAMDILMREGDASEELQWGDVLHDLNKEFPDLDIDEIVSLLKDIVKTSCDLIYYGRMRSAKESMKERIKQENFEESDQWEDIPSESLLSDVSSVCLVQNSDDSESEAMESCLEIDYL